MRPLPAGYTARPATLADLEELLAVMNAYRGPCLGLRQFTPGEGRAWLTQPGFDMAASTRAVFAPNGRMAGFIMALDLESPPVHVNLLGSVHPDYERRGIGTHLLEWAEERARQAVSRVPPEFRVALRIAGSAQHMPTMRLFEKMGIRAIRSSWLMRVDLDAEPPEPVWPGGLILTTFQDHPDLRGVYRAINEVYRDHWGYVEQDEDEALERWRSRNESSPDFDPSLWFLAMDGDEIAAAALCGPRFGIDRDMAWIYDLGVRRPWRRRGLALQLLRHAFREFRRRGRKYVGLQVDAQSLTGATHLYEKAGMYVAREVLDCEKELRPGREAGVTG